MKKHYEKPMVAIEYYELTQSIASCNININAQDRMCFLTDPDATPEMRNLAASFWFMSGQSGCTSQATPGVSYENGICYHTNTNAAFSS